MSLVIIDYGVGNPASVRNMFRKIGVDSIISSNPQNLSDATKLVLPGVGSFDHGVEQLQNLGLVSLLTELVVTRKVPILGICLGMQLMTLGSEEGDMPGMGWVNAKTIKFNFSESRFCRVPHMGWNSVEACKESCLLPPGAGQERFYFVHSYHVVCENSTDILAITKYGEEFTSAFQVGNIVGVQFHPEKSHRFGYAFLKNFAENFNG